MYPTGKKIQTVWTIFLTLNSLGEICEGSVKPTTLCKQQQSVISWKQLQASVYGTTSVGSAMYTIAIWEKLASRAVEEHCGQPYV